MGSPDCSWRTVVVCAFVGGVLGCADAIAADPAGWVAPRIASVPAAGPTTAGSPPVRMVPGHPALERAPRRTATTRGTAGDPINVAFIGSDREIHHALSRAGWYAADPITLETSLRIAADVVLRKPYPHAPVSDLYVWGRKQDLAFEQPFGGSPKQRHHVRFWRSAEVDGEGEPLWLGAATFDERVEISRTTGGVTHRIAPAVDRERNKLLTDTNAAGLLDGYYWVDRFHRELRGTNGGGDPFHTDGRLAVGVITLDRPADEPSSAR
ncbi:MAG: hypothetical protein FJ309_16205 [Planctomycetes bacterium]|nr:hypothetical protein [Planctomycetota bacterium]